MPTFVDLRPLLTGARGDRIAVGGVRVGEAARHLIANHEATGAEESSTGESLVFQHGTVFRKAADGALIEIPLASRIAGVLSKGGTLRFGSVAVKVDEGRVSRVFVRGSALEAIAARTESDLEQHFGAPDGIETAASHRSYHYPERQLVVCWEAREGRIEHVALGPDLWREPRRGARDLLAELMWSFEGLAAASWAEPPSGALRTRFRRIAALARALDLGVPRAVVEGTFLEGTLSAGRAELLLEIVRTVEPDRSKVSFPVQAFRRLLAYRVEAEQVIGFNRSVLECSIPLFEGIMLEQEAVGAYLKERLSVIDGWICRLLDPADRTFTESELTRHFGWPDVDVRHQEAEEAWL